MTISQPLIDLFFANYKKSQKLGPDDGFEVLNVSLAKLVQQYVECRYHLRNFQQLPHQMGMILVNKVL